MNWMALIVGDGLVELDPLLGESRRLLDQPVGGSTTPGRNHQPLVAEPLVREGHAVAFLPDEVGGRHPHVLEGHHGIVGGVLVRVRGRPDDADAGGVVQIHDEQSVGLGMRPLRELRLEERVVRVVEGGHVPLETVEDVLVAVQLRGGRMAPTSEPAYSSVIA